MSVLAKSEILREIKARRVKIQPFRPNCVRAASIDLHLANVFRVFLSPHKSIPVTDLTDFKRATKGIRVQRGSGIQLSPGETVLGITEEKVTLPDNICGWLEGRFGQGSRQIVGIAGKRQKAGCRMQKKAGGIEKSEAKGQSSTGPRGSEGAQNMWRAAVREAGRPGTPGGGPAKQQPTG